MKKHKSLTVSILDYDKEPFAFLEGGLGLNDTENYLAKGLCDRGFEVYILEELYEKPRKLAALQFLDIKTLVIGTTGVYANKLDFLTDLFFSLEMPKLENIILTLDTERVMRKQMSQLKSLKPHVKFYKLNEVLWDKDWTECNLYEIEP